MDLIIYLEKKVCLYMFKITAIICTYNRAKFLEKSLNSLFKQSLSSNDFEIIVVDNNSTDNTKEIFERCCAQNPAYKVEYIFEPRQGLSFARNTGWKRANSPFVYYLDDDGIASEELLEEYLKLFLKGGDKVVACGGKIIVDYDPDRPDWLPVFFERFYGDYSRGDEVVECEYVPGGNSAWRVLFLNESKGFSEELGRVGEDGAGCEESLLNMRALKMGYKLMYSPHALMYHYAGPSRLNLKWLLNRMRGQGKSSSKLVLMNSANKEKTAFNCFKKDMLDLLEIMFTPTIKEKNIKRELISRMAFGTEKIFRIRTWLDVLVMKKNIEILSR